MHHSVFFLVRWLRRRRRRQQQCSSSKVHALYSSSVGATAAKYKLGMEANRLPEAEEAMRRKKNGHGQWANKIVTLRPRDTTLKECTNNKIKIPPFTHIHTLSLDLPYLLLVPFLGVLWVCLNPRPPVHSAKAAAC